MNDDWRNNPKLAGMDRSKLDMLQNLASQGSSKGANEMLPFLMSAAAQGKKGGLKFNADEISAIIEVLKMGKSPAEAQKLDKVEPYENDAVTKSPLTACCFSQTPQKTYLIRLI